MDDITRQGSKMVPFGAGKAMAHTVYAVKAERGDDCTLLDSLPPLHTESSVDFAQNTPEAASSLCEWGYGGG
jgi:hypothetical protein